MKTLVAGDNRSPPPILGQQHSFNILGMPMLYRLICMVCDLEGPGVEFKGLFTWRWGTTGR